VTGPAKLAAGLILAGIAVATPVLAQSGKGAPFELVRALQTLQDQIARGNPRAHAHQRVLLARIAEQFGAINPEVWKEPRNARALVAFALSGGDARVVKKLMDSGVAFGVDEKLLKGAVAYGEGRKEEAQQLLAGIEARSQDAGIAGLVAFVQSELALPKEVDKALVHLDDARLLAPGTLIEEAALRRQTALLAAAGKADRYEALAALYLRRFPYSLYAGGFRHQFAAAIAGSPNGADPARLAWLQSMLGGMGSAERRDVYLAMAKIALVNGKVEMARFAAASAVQLTQEESPEHERARVYQGAALVATEEFERGIELLGGIEKGRLGEDDARLLEAALAVADQVRRMPGPPDAEAAPPPPAPGPMLERAQRMIAEVDQMLNGTGP
jgi:chemotaxis protein MotC